MAAFRVLREMAFQLLWQEQAVVVVAASVLPELLFWPLWVQQVAAVARAFLHRPDSALALVLPAQEGGYRGSFQGASASQAPGHLRRWRYP
jgi:hypothetical protein